MPAEAESVRFAMRASEEFRAAVDRRARRDGLSASGWAREVLVAVLASGLTLPELVQRLRVEWAGPLVAVPPARNGLGRVVLARPRCLHPPHQIRKYATFWQCSCGKVTWRMPPVGDPR